MQVKWSNENGAQWLREMAGESFLEVLLLLLDHLNLFLVWVPGFKPLFLLQASVLMLGFDLFCTFLSWVHICHTAQWFYPPADYLLRLMQYWLFLDCFFSSFPPPTSQCSTENYFLLLAAVSFRDCCGLSHWTSFIPADGCYLGSSLSWGGTTDSTFWPQHGSLSGNTLSWNLQWVI